MRPAEREPDGERAPRERGCERGRCDHPLAHDARRTDSEPADEHRRQDKPAGGGGDGERGREPVQPVGLAQDDGGHHVQDERPDADHQHLAPPPEREEHPRAARGE